MSAFDEVTEWLLEDTYPLTRYNALTGLLGRSHDEPEVQASLSQMLTSPPIQNIIRKQQPDGGFETKVVLKKYGKWEGEYGYIPKYKASTWEALFLAQANLPPIQHPVQTLGKYIIKKVYSKKLGRFLIGPCLNGRMIWVLSKFGFGNRPEVRSSFAFLVKHQRFDDGDYTPSAEEVAARDGWGEFCWGTASCYEGIGEVLRAMTAIPKAFWTAEALELKRQAIDFMLRHQVLHRRLKPGSKGFKHKSSYRFGEYEWLLRFQAPNIMVDAVDNITSLLLLGVESAALQDSIQHIINKRNSQNRFIADHVLSNVYGQWGKTGKESKWITFRILRMLKLASAQHLLD